MGNESDGFQQAFDTAWAREIASHNQNYIKAHQLAGGNRLRPILFAWGYFMRCPDGNIERIGELAVCVELIHKASILLDDFIDKDTARHGKPTFHAEYSVEEAVLYAVFLINRSMEKMAQISTMGFQILTNTLKSMVTGGLMEVRLTDSHMVDTIKEIIVLETALLIENCLSLGYLTASSDTDIPSEVSKLGGIAGYCFQILNDMEPFCKSADNELYKGGHNFDINNKRKNIVIAYLYGACNKSDRNLLSGGATFEQIIRLVEKHDIIPFILTELKDYQITIKQTIDTLSTNISNEAYFSAFRRFVTDMFTICYKKNGLLFEQTFFNE